MEQDSTVSEYNKEVHTPESAQAPQNETQYLETRDLVLVFLGFLMATLLITLDQTIIATALPQIVSHFNALGDVTWVVTAYFLTQGGLILITGQVLKVFPKKTIFLLSITLFETGSLICALSHSMAQLIAGRAIAGCGAAGIQKSGPILGGTFTDKLTWRWCFWINLPCGAVAILLVIVFLKYHSRPNSGQGTRSTNSWLRLDWIGGLLNLGFFTCLLLPVQWGGNTRPWNDAAVIALFVVAVVLLGAFLAWERYKGKEAMIPLEVLSRRTQIGCACGGASSPFISYLVLMIATYYLPLWYQARGHSATRSGLDILPYLIALVLAGAVSGGVVTKTGHYWWILLLCPAITAVGAGLLFTLRIDTPGANLIGYQILYGVGIGVYFQNVLLVAQADYVDDEDMIPQASSFVTFCQLLGGIIGIAIFSNNLRKNLDLHAPNLTPELKAAVLRSVSVIGMLP
ncbi:hypothetical protein MPER_11882 [Moniliophthora perniciosa FA553]|nr:hypothetical protein MPER_11882 [Moniliophthora perniciosa FA553]